MNNLPMIIYEEKNLASEVLKKFKVIDPAAVIAGGAPRDWYMDNKCNDIDIYLRAPMHKTDYHRKLIFSQFGFDAEAINPKDENYKSINGLQAVYEFEYKGKIFNIMFMSDEIAPPFTQHFSCSICEIAYDGYSYIPSQRFKDSILRGEIVLADGYEGTEKHIQKMMQRFPMYRFLKPVTPEVSFIPVNVTVF